MKKCFKCLCELPLSEFYRHPRMADGHLGKCKTCAKRDVAWRVSVKMTTDLDWVLAERERCRIKAQRLRLEGRQAITSITTKRLGQLKERAENPEKYAAHIKTGNAIRDGKLIRQQCEVCGKAKSQAHHDDYSQPLKVRWLCVKHHNEHHRKEREAVVIQRFHDRKNLPR